MLKRVNNGVIVGWWEGSSAEVPSHHPPDNHPHHLGLPYARSVRQWWCVYDGADACTVHVHTVLHIIYISCIPQSWPFYSSLLFRNYQCLFKSQSTRRWLRLLLLPHYSILHVILHVNIFDWHKSTRYMQFCIRHKVPTLFIILGARIVFNQLPRDSAHQALEVPM